MWRFFLLLEDFMSHFAEGCKKRRRPPSPEGMEDVVRDVADGGGDAGNEYGIFSKMTPLKKEDPMNGPALRLICHL